MNDNNETDAQTDIVEKAYCEPPSIDFPYALGEPKTLADFRTQPEDFMVDEDLGFEPSGEGEHLLLQIRKRGQNTVWVAEQLARQFSIRIMDVGFCGMKDRHAVTTQWFSLYLPTLANDQIDNAIATLRRELDGVEILGVYRHARKLRRGQHRANHFQITLRRLQVSEDLSRRLHCIQTQGVPNYFGEQRFGRHSSNLHWARRWFEQGEVVKNRTRKNMAKSAARAYLFNCVLGDRVARGDWCQSEGDWCTGPLWGRGRLRVENSLAERELAILEPWHQWLDALEHVGLQQDRRDLVLRPEHFEWLLSETELVLRFSLPPGTFATAVLRELAVLKNVAAAPETIDD